MTLQEANEKYLIVDFDTFEVPQSYEQPNLLKRVDSITTTHTELIHPTPINHWQNP